MSQGCRLSTISIKFVRLETSSASKATISLPYPASGCQVQLILFHRFSLFVCCVPFCLSRFFTLFGHVILIVDHAHAAQIPLISSSPPILCRAPHTHSQGVTHSQTVRVYKLVASTEKMVRSQPNGDSTQRSGREQSRELRIESSRGTHS